MEAQHIKNIPNGAWSIDEWEDGKYFSWINTKFKKIGGTLSITASCGCCSEYENWEDDWDNLFEDEQEMIVNAFNKNYYTSINLAQE